MADDFHAGRVYDLLGRVWKGRPGENLGIPSFWCHGSAIIVQLCRERMTTFT